MDIMDVARREINEARSIKKPLREGLDLEVIASGVRPFVVASLPAYQHAPAQSVSSLAPLPSTRLHRHGVGAYGAVSVCWSWLHRRCNRHHWTLHTNGVKAITKNTFSWEDWLSINGYDLLIRLIVKRIPESHSNNLTAKYFHVCFYEWRFAIFELNHECNSFHLTPPAAHLAYHANA